MANKDSSLDEKIIKAAWEEFLSLGYLKASMRSISARAGITTGALYRRYKGKKELFYSLIKGMLLDFNQDDSKRVEELYREAFNKHDSSIFIEAIKLEEKIYLDLLFKHYDECYLIMVKALGSEIYDDIAKAIAYKNKETIEFFSRGGGLRISYEALELILNMQMNMYREIICRGYSKDKAVEVVRQFEDFMLPSWKHLFEEMI